MRTIFLGFLLLAFSLPLGMVWSADNIIVNASFEKIDGQNPSGWMPNTWGGRARFQLADSGRTGSKCVMIESTSGADAAWSQNIPAKPLMRYRLTGWVKTENLVAENAYGALFNIHGLEDARSKGIKGSQDWTQLKIEFETEVSDSITVNCLFGGWGQATGKAWYDDVTLEELGPIPAPEPKQMSAFIEIDGSSTNEPISKYIYGQFIEHLGRCIYGGIWAEMLEDRKFHYDIPAKNDTWVVTGQGARVLRDSPWKVIGNLDSVKMIVEGCYGEEHTPCIEVDDQPVGLSQDELGLVAGKEYVGRIVLSGNFKGSVELRLVSGKDDLAVSVYTIKRISKDYKKYHFTLKAKSSTDHGRLEIIGKGEGSICIGAVSLMPDDNINGFRADTLELLKQLNAPVYRWPGGNFVSGYDWRDGIGDPDLRPTRRNPAWTGIETNDVGIDEFIELCRLIDTEPMIAVNTGFGDAYSAADEVEYCNGDSKTRMGKWRTQNGHKAPYNVKWWCVGNEMFGSWQLGYMALNHYVLKHNWVESMMRKVDPDIIAVGVGDAGRWSEGMLRNCADHMDYLSEHFYCQNRSNVPAHVKQMVDAIRNKCNAHRRYRRDIEALQGKDIRIAMDEWNYWYGPHIYGELGTRYYTRDMLGVAAGLHEYYRNSDICYMANYAQTVNVIGCIKTTKTEAGFDTTALPLMLYRKEFGVIPVAVQGNYDPVDVSAAWTADKKAMTIAVVNPSMDIWTLNLKLDNVKLGPVEKAWIIDGKQPLAYNEPGKEPQVKIETINSISTLDTIVAQPYTIALYRVKAN